MRTFVLYLFILACATTDAVAQPAPDLDRVDSLAAAGRLTDAREALARWQERQSDDPRTSPDQRAHGFLLRARLATNADSAIAEYRAVAFGYPTSPFAAEALLRLAQGLLASSSLPGANPRDRMRAVQYLQRLLADHPRSPHARTAAVWLARVRANSHTRA